MEPRHDGLEHQENVCAQPGLSALPALRSNRGGGVQKSPRRHHEHSQQCSSGEIYDSIRGRIDAGKNQAQVRQAARNSTMTSAPNSPRQGGPRRGRTPYMRTLLFKVVRILSLTSRVTRGERSAAYHIWDGASRSPGTAPGGPEVDQLGEHVGEVGLRIDAVQFAGLCRPANYAERFRDDASLSGCRRLARARRLPSIRHSLVRHSASRKASRRSLGRKRVRLPCSYGFSFARAASLSARWAWR